MSQLRRHIDDYLALRRALGFKLVPYEEWQKRIHTFVAEPPTLSG